MRFIHYVPLPYDECWQWLRSHGAERFMLADAEALRSANPRRPALKASQLLAERERLRRNGLAKKADELVAEVLGALEQARAQPIQLSER